MKDVNSRIEYIREPPAGVHGDDVDDEVSLTKSRPPFSSLPLRGSPKHETWETTIMVGDQEFRLRGDVRGPDMGDLEGLKEAFAGPEEIIDTVLRPNPNPNPNPDWRRL